MAKLNQAMTDLLRYNNAIVERKRSLFDKSHSHATTLDSAFLVPIMWDRVVPGDEKKIRYSGLCRMATPLHPTMDEAYLYTWAFYIPDRLWWSHAKEFYGENLDASFNPDGEYTMPSIPDTLFLHEDVHSLTDYLGIPVGKNFNSRGEVDIIAGLHRSYQLLWNTHFRNSSIQPALRLNDGDYVSDDEWKVIKELRRVNKIPDMFTSLLLEPQAGDDVTIPMGSLAPVVTGPDHTANTGNYKIQIYDELNGEYLSGDRLIGIHDGVVYPYPTTSSHQGLADLRFSNLYADLSSASSASINSLRTAITLQQLYETDAIGGKRYQNLIYAHYGVFTPDATVQRPELIGATKTRIGMRQVLATNKTDELSVGEAGGVSVTNVDNEWICNKAFTEPGFIMVLCAVRPLHSYSQGLNPLLRKFNRFDHYYPVLDNIGNQPVYLSEVYLPTDGDGLADSIDTVFGWKEAWTEYRMMDNRVSGLFRPDVAQNLASWNYSTNFESTPVLNSEFILEDPTLIDRTIAVMDQPQFILDNYFEYHDIKNMSVHSTPGLTRL